MTFEQLLLAAVEQRLLRPLDVQFALMVAQNDPPAVKLAAALLSRDAGEGHVCLPLSRLSGDEALSGKAGEIRDRLLAEAGAPEDWPALLLASSAVSCGDAPAPMILCGDRLYLNRMWRNELTVARFFNEANRVLEMDEARLASTLNALFPATGETDWQKVAAAVALTRRISVISGGPGTGKTTTVAKLLAALIQIDDSPRCRIRLAAPTGKAAARLPNTSCFAAPGWKAETQVMRMDLAGFAISAGSACSSGKVRAGRTLAAMGFDPEVAASAVRVSIGPTTTRDQILAFVEVWSEGLRRFRRRAA